MEEVCGDHIRTSVEKSPMADRIRILNFLASEGQALYSRHQGTQGAESVRSGEE